MENTIHVTLTQTEREYLGIEMNTILREYGKCFTNPCMASAFNKVLKACFNSEDHENIKKYLPKDYYSNTDKYDKKEV